MTARGPQTGDILASERSARADVFTVSVVPNHGQESVMHYSDVIELVKTLAHARRVNGWLTIDHTHYVQVASHRSADTGQPFLDRNH
jgi:hypothetical protein